jgi:hypothetical protein
MFIRISIKQSLLLQSLCIFPSHRLSLLSQWHFMSTTFDSSAVFSVLYSASSFQNFKIFLVLLNEGDMSEK